MNFGSGGNTKAKAWKDLWSAGQGIGGIKDAPAVAQVIAAMRKDYDEAVASFGRKYPAPALNVRA
jgi:nitronate monooxygenase